MRPTRRLQRLGAMPPPATDKPWDEAWPDPAPLGELLRADWRAELAGRTAPEPDLTDEHGQRYADWQHELAQQRDDRPSIVITLAYRGMTDDELRPPVRHTDRQLRSRGAYR